MKDIFELDEYEQQIENVAELYVPIDEETVQKLRGNRRIQPERKNHEHPHPESRSLSDREASG